MKTTKLKPSRFNTKTNWEMVNDFFDHFNGDVVLDEDHRIVSYEIYEEEGLVLNLGQTTWSNEPVEQLFFCPECVNRGTIQRNRLTLSEGKGKKTTLDFYHLNEATIE